LPELFARGFVVYRWDGGGVLYLALRNARHGGVGLPKGHARPGEDEIETALRETEEETGLAPADLEVNRFFRRRIRYRVKAREKDVLYLLARARRAEVRLSPEHSEHAWLPLEALLDAVGHENLRQVVRDAAVFVKDPALRRGLDAKTARALLEARVGGGEPVLAHSALVARLARAVASAWGRVDPDYVETCAWVHDVGRAVTHGPRHPVEGFRLLAAAGHGGYAPPCISHFTKGASFEELAADPGMDPGLLREMWEACDLSTFPREERCVALADAMAIGARRATIEERYADLAARYGDSPTVRRNLRISLALRQEFERATGRPLDEVAVAS
jgi:bis(5'-nucleosidyl)-tetraphosphatase